MSARGVLGENFGSLIIFDKPYFYRFAVGCDVSLPNVRDVPTAPAAPEHVPPRVSRVTSLFPATSLQRALSADMAELGSHRTVSHYWRIQWNNGPICAVAEV